MLPEIASYVSKDLRMQLLYMVIQGMYVAAQYVPKNFIGRELDAPYVERQLTVLLNNILFRSFEKHVRLFLVFCFIKICG